MKTLRRYRKPVAWLMILLMATYLPGGQAWGLDLYKSTNNVGFNRAPAYSQNLVPTAADTVVFGNQLTSATTFELLTDAAGAFVGGTFSIGGLRFQNNMGGVVTFRPSNNLNNTFAIGAGGIDMSAANQNVSFQRTQGSGVLTLNTSAAQQWQVGNGRILTIGADISGNQAVTISGKAGTDQAVTPGGTVILSGNNGASGLGALTVINSTVQLDHNDFGQNKLNDTATLTLERSNLVLAGGSTVNTTETIGGLLTRSGLSSITRGSNLVTLATGALSRQTGGVLNFGAADIATTTTANVNGILGGAYVINGSDWATRGASNLVKTFSTYTSSTDPSSWGTTTNLAISGNIDTTFATNAGSNYNLTVNSLKLTGATTLTKDTFNEGTDSLFTILSGGILSNSNSAKTISMNRITAGVSNGSADELFVWNGQNTITMDTVIVNNGSDTLHLTKAGLGTLSLIQPNTYTGTTTIAQGTLQLGNGFVSGNAGTLGTGAVVNDGTLLINKTVNSSIPNSISGLGGLTKETAGNLTLSGTNTFSGDTLVKGGSLLAGSAGGFASRSTHILQGSAILNLNGFSSTVGSLSSTTATPTVSLGSSTLTLTGNNIASQTYQGAITGTGGLIKNGDGQQILSGSGVVSYSGTTVINGGILRVQKSLATSGITVNSGTLLTTVSGAVPDAATVSLGSSTAVWTLSNSVTETVGGLSSSIGSRLDLGTGSTSTGVSLIINDNGGSARVANGVITGVNASLTKNGTNSLTLGGGNSFTGPLTINNGIVTLSVATPNVGGVLNDTVGVSIANVATAGLALGSDEAIGSLNGGGALGGNVDVGTKTLSTGLSGSNDTFSGQLLGTTGGLRKIGNGSLTLTNNSPFTGTTTVINGTLNLSAPGGNTLAAGSRMIVNGIGAQLNVNSNQTFSTLQGGYNALINLNGANLTVGAGNPVTPVSATIGSSGTTTDIVQTTTLTNIPVVVGQAISGTNIPAGARVVAILGGNQLQISIPVGGNAPSGSLALSSDPAVLGTSPVTGKLVHVASTVSLAVGMSVTGTNIAPGSTIAAIINGTTIQLNNDVLGQPTGQVFASTAVSAGTPGINTTIVRLASTAGLTPGMIVSGTNIPTGAVVSQVIDGNNIRISIPVGGTAPAGTMTVVPVTPLSAQLTGTGSFTFAGSASAATLQLQTKATYTGDTNVTGGTLVLGGDRIYSNVLPTTSTLNIATGATVQVLSSAGANLRSYHALGGLTGGGNFNLLTNSNSGALVVGVGDLSSSFTGNIAGGAGVDTVFMKVGNGTFTWTNAAANTHDGHVRIDGGILSIAGANGLDANNSLVLSNKAGTEYNPTATDAIKSLSGGGRVMGNVLGSLGGTPDTTSVGGSYLSGGASDTGGVVRIASGATLSTGLTTAASTLRFGGDITGAGAFTKGGAYIQELWGNINTTGNISVSSGTLRLGIYGAATGIGTPTPNGGIGFIAPGSNVIAPATLDLNGSNTTLNSLTAATAGTIALANGSLTILTTTGTSGTLPSAITGTGDVNVQSTIGTWSLSGNNTFTGNLNITGGTVALTRTGGSIADTARVNVGSGATLVVTQADTIGNLTGSGTLTLTSTLTLLEGRAGTWSGSTSGAGGLTLDGLGGLRITSNQSYTGATTVNRGSVLTLDYRNGANNIVPATLVLGGGSLNVIGGTTDVAASTALTASSSTMGGNNTVRNLGAGMLGLGVISRNAGTTLQVYSGGAATGSTNTNNILGGWAVADQTSWAVANGAGSAISALADVNYTANSWGTATVNSDVTTGIAAATGSVFTVRFNTAAANTVTLTGNSRVDGAGILITPNVGANDSIFTTGGAFTLSGGAAAPVANELIIHNHNIFGNLRMDVPIANNAAATRLTVTGLGRTILLRDNTFSGIVTISEGVLQVGDNGTTGNLGAGASAGVVNDGNIVFKRGSGAAVLEISTGSAQIISGRGSLRQEGAGIIRLSGTNTYTGRTTVAAGTLQVNNAAALGSAAGITSVLTGGTLSLFNSSSAMTIAEPIELAGGTLVDVSGAAAATNALTGAIYLSNDSSVNVVTGDTLRFTGTIFGVPDQNAGSPGAQSAGITASGAGSLRLEGNAFYVGSTTVSVGSTLQVGNAGAAGNIGTGALVNNGTFIMNRSDTIKLFTNTLSGNGVFQKDLSTSTASSSLFLQGDLSAFTGSYVVNNGSLVFGNDGFLPSNVLAGNKTASATFSQTGPPATTDVFLRLNFQNDLVVDSGNYSLSPYSGAAPGRQARLAKAGLGAVQIDGQLRSARVVGATTGLGITEIANGVLKLNGGMTGLGGVGANTGEFSVSNTRNYGAGVSYLELTGTANSNFAGRFSSGTGVMVMNSSGTLSFTQPAGISQANNDVRGLLGYRGTIEFNATGGGDAWKDTDGFMTLAGSQLNVITNETVGQLGSLHASTITLGSGATLTLNGNSNVNNRSGVLSGKITGTGSLVLSGSGNFGKTHLLTNEANDFTTDLTISYGQAQVTSIANKTLPSAAGAGSRIILNPGSGDGQYAALTFISNSAAGGSSDRDIALDGTSTAMVRALIANGAGALTWSGPVNNITAGTNRSFALDGSSTRLNTFSGLISNGSSDLSLVKRGSGLWTVTNTNTYTGTTHIQEGTLRISSFDAINGANTAAALRIGNGGTGAVFEYSGAATSTAKAIDFAATTGTPRVVNLGSGALTLTGALTFGAGGKTVVLGRYDDTPGFVNSFTQPIIDNSASNPTGLQKEGRSSWYLSGANTFTGTITMVEGTLRIASPVLGARRLNMNNSNGRGAVLELDSNASFDQVGHTNGFTGFGNEIKLTGGNTFTFNGTQLGNNNSSGNSNYYNGVISGDGSVIKNSNSAGDQDARMGFQTQIFPNAGLNTFTGNMTINSGRVLVMVLANGGQASGIGAGSAANTGLTLSGITDDDGLMFLGVTSRSTDRLLSLGITNGKNNPNTIWADGIRIAGLEESTVKFTGTDPMGFVGSGTRRLTLRGGNIGDNEFNMAIGDGAGGATELVKFDGGAWVLGGNNNFTGGVTVSGGVLTVTHNNALGTSAGGVNVNAGAAMLELQGNLTVTGETFTFGAGDAGLAASLGASTWTGSIAVNNNARFLPTTGSTITLTGAMTTDGDGAALLKMDAGTLVMAGNNTGMTNANNDLTVAGGTLRLDYTAGGNAALSKLSDAGDITFGGTGNVTAVNVAASNYAAQRQVWQEGSRIDLVGGAHTEIVAATTLNAGQSFISRSSGSSILQLNGLGRNIGGTLDFSAGGIAQTDNNNSGALGILGGWATVGKENWAASVNTGANNTAINAIGIYTNNSYSSPNANVDVSTNAAPASFAGNVNSLRFNTPGGATITLAGSERVGSGGILVSNKVTSDFTMFDGAGEITAGSANASTDLILHNWSGRTVTFNVPVENNGSGSTSLTVTGDGTLVLAKTNGFSGQLTVNGGILQIGTGGSSGSLGNGQGFVYNNGTIILNAGRTFTHTGTINGNGGFIMNMGDITLGGGNGFHGDFVMNGGTLTITNGGALGTTIGRTILNSGTRLNISNSANSGEYLVVNQGATLGNIVQGNAVFSGRIDFQNTTVGGAVIDVVHDAAGTALSLSNIIKASNGFTKTGDGNLRISNSNWVNGAATLAGQVVINGGVLWAENARAMGLGGAGNETIINNGATVEIRGNNFAYGDDPAPAREIFRISGTGVDGVGALRSTAGNEGRLTTLELGGNATIGGGGSMLQSYFDSSGLREFRRDGYASNDQNNTGDIMRIRVIRADRDAMSGSSADNLGASLSSVGGTYSISKIGVIEYEFRDTAMTGISSINVNEGELRLLDELSNTSFNDPAINPYVLENQQGSSRSVMTTGQVGAVQVVYNGPTASLRGIQSSATINVDQAVMSPLIGARLDLFRQHLTQHTSPVSAFGSSGVRGNIDNNSSIELNSDTLAYAWTKLGGQITLTGMTNGANTFFNIEGGGFGVGNGDAVLGTRSPAGPFFVNPGSLLVVSGDGTTPAMTGTGGFTKIGTRELRLTGSTNFTGDVVITRSTNTGLMIDPNNLGSRGDFIGGITLYGAGSGTVGGTLGGTSNIILDRNGLLRIDNTNDLDLSSFGVAGGNNNNRINDTANLVYRNGFVIFDNEAANAETIGAVQVQRGNNYLAFNLAPGSGNTTLTASSMTRSPGSVLAISDWDVASTFSINTTGDSLKITLGDSGAALGLIGIGTTANTTNLRVAPGIFGGKLPLAYSMINETRPDDPVSQFRNLFFTAGRDFMTVEGTTLRPLDNDEYATALTAGQNVNLEASHTSLLSSVSINALRLGNLNDNDSSGGAVAGTSMMNIQAMPIDLTLSDNSTLSIASGMILSTPFGVAQRNNISTYINGGTIDAGGSELILHNVNLSYRLQDGIYEGFNMEVRSTLAGSGGLTKSGFQQVVLDGRNTFTGQTSSIEGNLYLRNSMALGAGRSVAQPFGTNGITVEGSGSFMYATGINIGSVLGNPSLDAHYEDLTIRTVNGDQRILMRSDGQVNRFNGDISADLVDASGHVLFADNRINVNAQATMVLTGDIYGGNSRVSNDEYITDARSITTNGSGNGFILFKGQFGDRSDGAGGVLPIAFNPSILPSDGATRTHQNEVTRFWIGGSQEVNFNSYQQWNAVGQLQVNAGYLRYMGDGNFYTTDAAAKINSVPGSELLPMVGFQMGSGTSQSNVGIGTSSDMAALVLTKPGQTFNLSNFVIGNTGGTAMLGGENESGVVTFGTGAGSILQSRPTRYYAAAGGRVDVLARLLSGAIEKGGRGEVVMAGSSIGGGSAGGVNVQGGILRLDYGSNNNDRFSGSANLTLSGGTLHLQSWNGLVPANTTQNAAKRGDAGTSFIVNNGGNELIVEGRSGNVMTLSIGTGPINSTNGNTTAISRAAGATINFVEMTDGTANSGAVITLLGRSGLVQNVAIPFATYGTNPRTAIDFAMGDDINDGISSYLRVSDEYKNDITTWATSEDLSENGGAGFFGTLVPSTTTVSLNYPDGNTHNRVVNTLRFDSNAESAITLGPDDKLIVGSGGILTTTNVGAANKTIAGGTSTLAYTTPAASVTDGSNLVSGVNTTGLYAGMRVNSPHLPTGSYITTILGPTSFEVSSKAFATGGIAIINAIVNVLKEGGLTTTVAATAEGTTTDTSTTLSGFDTSALFPGLRVSGAGIPANSFITSVIDATSVSISSAATVTANGNAVLTFGAPELILHHFAQGALNISAPIVGTQALVIGGPSVTSATSLANWPVSPTSHVVLTGNNVFTGRTYIGGSILTVDSITRLGVAPATTVTGQLYVNGGAFRWTGASEQLGGTRAVQVGSNGAVFDVVSGDAVLTFNAAMSSENGGNNHATGDLIKVGAGVLEFNTNGNNDGSFNNGFIGGIDVRQGTLRISFSSSGTSGTTTSSMFGTNRSAIDDTTFRPGTRLEFWNGAGAGATDYAWEEWFRFDGDNTIQFGQPGAATQRVSNLNGVIDLVGNVTMNVTEGATARLNNGGGYLTGTGMITKTGQGTLEFRDNNIEWSGQLRIDEGAVLLASSGRPAGMSAQPIVVGGSAAQGIADLRLHNENVLPGSYVEVFQPIDITYNPLQTKRLQIVSPQHNGQDHYFWNTITMNDNLIVTTQDGTLVSGGKFDWTYFKGSFVDGASTSGNLTFHTDDANNGAANNQVNGGIWGYHVLGADNSGWSGDVTVGLNTVYDRDEVTILRLEHNNALTNKNDVTLAGSSVLQLAGRTVTVGSMFTPGAVGEAGNSSFTGAIIENAATTPGLLTITQTTPANTEVQLSATIRDGLPADHYYQTNGLAGAALNIVKDGNGWLTITQDNQQTGSFQIKAGVLQVGLNGFGDTGATNAAGMTVKTGGTLAGTGIVQGASTIEVGATVAPGDVAGTTMGTLAMNGNAYFAAGSTLSMQLTRATFNAPELNNSMQANYAALVSSIPTTYAAALNSPVLNTQHDHLDIYGEATFDAGAKIVLSFIGGYTPVAGDVINLIDWASVLASSFNAGSAERFGGESGTDLDLPALSANLVYNTSLFKSDGVLLINYAPEPSRALLLGLALLGLMLRRRR